MTATAGQWAYKNADDTVRVMISSPSYIYPRRLGISGWEVGAFFRSGESFLYPEAGGFLASRKKSFAWATGRYGALTPLREDWETITEGWNLPSSGPYQPPAVTPIGNVRDLVGQMGNSDVCQKPHKPPWCP